MTDQPRDVVRIWTFEELDEAGRAAWRLKWAKSWLTTNALVVPESLIREVGKALRVWYDSGQPNLTSGEHDSVSRSRGASGRPFRPDSIPDQLKPPPIGEVRRKMGDWDGLPTLEKEMLLNQFAIGYSLEKWGRVPAALVAHATAPTPDTTIHFRREGEGS